MNDKKYMALAIEEAKKGMYLTRSNPLVGALLIKDNKIIKKAHHSHFGGDHAELDLLKDLRLDQTKDATLYCTLEPCCHNNKKTPPCVPLIIEKKIKRLVIASKDPNPNVNGKGLEALKEAGIEISSGVLEKEARELNQAFYTNMIEKRAYVHLKWAQTIDGKIVLENGVSKWITGTEAREDVQRLRAQNEAILIGSKTLEKDNPSLNVREIAITKNPNFIQPKTIIISSKKIDLSNKKINNNEKILIESKIKDWNTFFKDLYYNHKISKVLVEAGPNILSQLIDNNIADEISVFIAPKISMSGISLSSKKLEHFDQAHQLHLNKIKTYNNGDISLNYRRP